MCGNAKIDWAGQKTNSSRILCKLAQKSVLIDIVLLSEAPEARFLRKTIGFFNYLFPGKRLGAISQKLGNWNFAIVTCSNKKDSSYSFVLVDIILDGANITDGTQHHGREWENSKFPVSDLSPPSVFRGTNN